MAVYARQWRCFYAGCMDGIDLLPKRPAQPDFGGHILSANGALRAYGTVPNLLDVMMLRRYLHGMRTTINLDQDILEVARSLAATQGISIGAAVSTLARRGISGMGDARHQSSSGEGRFPTFHVGERAPRFGTEDVRQALNDE